MNLDSALKSIPPLNEHIRTQTKEYIKNLTKPPGSLGRLESIAEELAAMTAHPFPDVQPPGILVFASDHGIVEEGISAFPQEITTQMAKNFLHGGAAINVFAKQIGAQFRLVDIGMAADLHEKEVISRKIKRGTSNFYKEDAMTRDDAFAALQGGFQEAKDLMKEKNIKCLILGEMGIGNTTASSAVLAALTGKSPALVTGAGTGLSQERILHKQRVLEEALQARNFDKEDPIDVLAKVGGFEIAAMTGAMIAAASQRIPILIDGFISATAAVTAKFLSFHTTDYMFVGHHSTEPGHSVALEVLEKKPLLDLNMRLGEGSGAALAYPILRSACAMVRDMATFDDLNTY